MEQHIVGQLAPWANFYVIIGSASAALIGLQFVVIVLSSNRGRSRSEATANAFATPTIVHFCAALVVAATLAAPWPALVGPALTLGGYGLSGVIYSAVVVRRTQRQTSYKPVLEDWIFHGALPLLAYAILLIGAALLVSFPAQVLFVVGAAQVLLLFVGIHNAWDAAVFIAMNAPSPQREAADE